MPSAEIITIGDEIVSGHSVDTNSSFIARKISSAGIEVKYHSSVGDSLAPMEELFRSALSRVDLVITTGGLGPTDDDITKKALVKVFGRKLIYHDEILKDIEERYAARGITMPAINQNQALLPEGATFLKNRLGSAVGILLERDGKILVALPGVPAEMKTILKEELIPLFNNRCDLLQIAERIVRTSGMVESELAEKISSEIPLPDGVKLAYLPHTSGVDLRLVARGENADMINDAIEQPEGWLKRKLGKVVYGGKGETLESVVGALLKENKATLATAESMSAGMISARIVNVPGASEYFLQSFVTYSDRSKIDALGVKSKTLKKFGAVSKETALEMVKGALEKSGADYAIADTGIAGPAGANDEKPVGLVWIAVAYSRDGELITHAKKFLFGTDRRINRERATSAALNFLRLALLNELDDSK